MSADKPDRALIAYRDHCRRQADQPNPDPLWTVLADEVDRYLTDSHNGQQPEGQDTLI